MKKLMINPKAMAHHEAYLKREIEASISGIDTMDVILKDIEALEHHFGLSNINLMTLKMTITSDRAYNLAQLDELTVPYVAKKRKKRANTRKKTAPTVKKAVKKTVKKKATKKKSVKK